MFRGWSFYRVRQLYNMLLLTYLSNYLLTYVFMNFILANIFCHSSLFIVLCIIQFKEQSCLSLLLQSSILCWYLANLEWLKTWRWIGIYFWSATQITKAVFCSRNKILSVSNLVLAFLVTGAGFSSWLLQLDSMPQ